MSSRFSVNPAEFLYNDANLRTLVGILVEKAGGVVEILAEEYDAHVHLRPKRLYIEVGANSIRLETIPDV